MKHTILYYWDFAMTLGFAAAMLFGCFFGIFLGRLSAKKEVMCTQCCRVCGRSNGEVMK
jgi:hypothetical protein